MQEVNGVQADSEHVETHVPGKPGKRKLPVERKRVLLAERVLPRTVQYLDGMGYKTKGRALDVLVSALQHPGIVRMIESKSDFSVINLTG